MNSDCVNLGEMGHALTLRMTSVVKGLKDKYAALYNTSDFISKIIYLNKCNPDETGSVQAELIHMFNMCGVHDVKSGQPVLYYKDVLKTSDIPTPKKMNHKVYESFFQEFVDNPYPLPEEYIARIVDQKIPPKWNGDTLRVKILKIFIRDANALKGAGYKSGIIKQFIKGKTKKKTITKSDILDFLDDSIFELLEDADHQQSRKDGRYGLLKISDDLAQGRFGNANVVREEIYLFAIVFELMYFTGDAEELVMEEDRERDIENVMFGDYYTNNIMRYISSGHKYIKSGGEQKNPTGKGINYKNYMEAIFLYFLRRLDLNAEEKISGVYKMAGEVHAEYMKKKKGMDSLNDVSGKTQFYGEALKKNVLEKEEQFKNFLISNYDCSMPPETTPVFSIEAEQNTAMEEYAMLREDLMQEMQDQYGDEIRDEHFMKDGLKFLVDEIDKERINKICKKK